MYNTGNAVPSAALEDMADNAQVFDALVTQTEDTTTDRLGRTRRVFQQILMDMGFQPLAGSFQAGATITARNQTLYDEASKVFYAWGGALPKVVAAGSTPTTAGGVGVGAWSDKTDLTLRDELSSVDSDIIIADSLARDVAKDSKRRIYASSYGFDGSTTDFKSLLKLFMAEPANKIIDVNIYTSGVAAVADFTKVTAWGDAKIYPLGDVTLDVEKSANNQGQILESGNGCTFTGVVIDGLGLKGNGILNSGKSDVVIQLCDLSNGLGQSILDFGGIESKYINNTCYKSLHGIQLWLTNGAKIYGNEIYQVTGGIWSAAAQNVLAWGNTVHDCSDVGIDWEGGNNCHSFDNRVWACAHGELAIFATAPELVSSGVVMGNLSHKNNYVARYATFKNKSGVATQNDLGTVGAVTIYGLDTTLNGPIAITDNKIYVVDSSATITSSLKAIHTEAVTNESTDYLIIDNNHIDTKAATAFLIQEVNKLMFTGNKILFTGSSAAINTLKNHHTGDIAHNSFKIEAGATLPTNLLYVYTDKAMRGKLSIRFNEFENCGPTPLHIDQYVSERRISIQKNDFGSFDVNGLLYASTTGGIKITNGYVRYIEQKIKLLLGDNSVTDLSLISGLFKSQALGQGEVIMSMGGVGPVYRIAILSNDHSANLQLQAIDTGGAYNTGLFPNAARRVDFSGRVITLVDSDVGTANSAVLNLTMSSRY